MGNNVLIELFEQNKIQNKFQKVVDNKRLNI